MHIDHLANEDTAVRYLAACLREGTLVMVLGAGTSASVGLPAWPELIASMGKEVGDKKTVRPSDSADSLQAAADRIRRTHFPKDEAGYARLVKKCLYSERPLPTKVLTDRLLISLGALMTGSRRGSVRRVITFNFDSVLEWYLKLHGLVTQVVHSVPRLEGSEDVRIYHPHGYLPHPGMKADDSGFVVLGLDTVNKRLGTPGDPWMEVMRHVLQTGVCLFIGLSMRSFRDRAIAPLLATIGPILKDRPTGFWLFSNADGVDSKMLFDHNVVPLILKGRKAYPEFLLSICRSAAGEDVGAGV